jgi:ribonuclease Z
VTGRIAFLAAVVLVLTGALAAHVLPPRLVDAFIDRAVSETFEARAVDEDRFALHFCGTGSPQHQADRSQSCLALLAGGRLFLFDAGPGSSQRLREANLPITRLEAVFLTHLHSDHVSGLGDVLQVSWTYGRRGPVEVYGPPGSADLLDGFALVFQHDVEERRGKSGLDGMTAGEIMGQAREIDLSPQSGRVVYERDGVVIRAFTVVHPSWEQAFGYSISHRGKTIVISGDTNVSQTLIAEAAGADLLIHEAYNARLFNRVGAALERHGGDVDPERLEQVAEAHTSTHDLARLAQEAGVGAVYVTHLIPSIPANRWAEAAFIEGMDRLYDGPITVARDGMQIELDD